MSNPTDPAHAATETQPDTEAAGGPGGRSATTAAPGESRTDSGREAQPADPGTVEEQADTAERLERQNRPFDDAAGINPDRSQTTRADVTDGGPEH